MFAPLLSTTRKAELLARYPAEDTPSLAKAFGLTKRQVMALASNNGVQKKNGDGRTSEETYSRQVQAAVQAAGRAGLSRAEAITRLPNLSDTSVCKALHKLAHRGLLHRAGLRFKSRWFALSAHADEHQASVMTTLRLQAEAKLRAPVSISVWPRGPAHHPGEPIVPEGLEPVRCPSPVTAQPTEPGLFKNLGPGRYIDHQPKTWVDAITSKDQGEGRDTTHRKAA